MEDFYAIPAERLSKTWQVLQVMLKERGWGEIRMLKSARNVSVIAKRPDGKELRFYNITPPGTEAWGVEMARNKYQSYVLMKELGIKQPETEVVDLVTLDDATREKISALTNRAETLVVKPVDGAHGADVMMGLKTADGVRKALHKLKDHGTKAAIVQEELTPKLPEVRAIVIDGKFVAAYARIPAAVTGDGKHTVRELIRLENETIRTRAYVSNLSYINEAAAERYIKRMGIEKKIPAAGEKVRVMDVCNTGQGGTMEEVTDKFPEARRQLAEKIAAGFSLRLLGVDFLDDYVIEVNAAPALYHPVEGKGATRCIERYVEFLEKI